LLFKLKKPILFYALVNLSILSKVENSEKALMSHSIGHKERDIRNESLSVCAKLPEVILLGILLV